MSVPVLSQLFVARGNSAGVRRGAAKGRPRRYQLGQPTDAPGLGPRTPGPNPQSQSFSRSYGSILPTSLIYIVLSTRGCSPWRPDAVMSTTEPAQYPLPQIFTDRRRRTGHREKGGAFPAAGPYLRVNRFQGGRAVKKKRELFPGPPPASLGSLALPPAAESRFGNVNPIPFRWAARIAPLKQVCPIS